MELDKYNTAANLQDLLSIRDDIDILTERHLPQSVGTPKIDVFDIGSAYRVVVEVPGVSQENLEVAIQDDTLIVAGLREPVEENVRIITSERYRGHFQREIKLPSKIEQDAGQAHLHDGLMILTLPKKD